MMGKLTYFSSDNMEVKIKIEDEYRKFHYDGDLNITVITLLEELGNRVDYSCSCLQGLCGACAMVINGEPKLACQTFLKDEQMTKEYGVITIEPLSKFPLIKDLKVDRSILYDSLKNSRLWLDSDADIKEDDLQFEYEMSLCIMCGCCCEACPNYDLGDFFGAHIPVSASKLINQEKDSAHVKEIKKSYKKGFYNHCVKSLACEDTCPAAIPTQRAISRMNRKAVWRIRDLFNHD